MAEYGASFPILVLILCRHVEYTVLHRGLHVRVVVVCSPLSRYGEASMVGPWMSVRQAPEYFVGKCSRFEWS